MSTNYILPQVRVFQQYAKLPLSVVQNQNAFVFGENYYLWRYRNSQIKDKLLVTHYDLEGTDGISDISIPMATGRIDPEYTKVFADNALVVYGGLLESSGALTGAADTDNPFNVELNKDLGVGEDEEFATVSGVSAGDILMWGNNFGQRAIVTAVRRGTDGKLNVVTIDRGDAPQITDTAFRIGRVVRDVVIGGWTSNSENHTVTLTQTEGKGIPVGELLGKDSDSYIAEADIYVEFRQPNYSLSDKIVTISSTDQLLTDVGFDIHPDDPLTYGTYMALANSADKSVYVAAVGEGDNKWSTTLSMSRNMVGPYALAPLTDDPAVIDMVNSHVNDASGAETKRWRIAFVGTEAPNRVQLLESPSLIGEVTVDDDTSIKLSDPEGGVNVNAYKLKVGDTVECYNNGILTGSVKVSGITDNETIIVDNSSSKLTNGTTYDVSIFRPSNPNDQAEIIKNRSEAMHSRRMYHVYAGTRYTTDSPSGSHVVTDNYFLSAAVAGLLSSVPPQQGMTNIEIRGVRSVTDMYNKYTVDQLNLMASGGTLLIQQDHNQGACYIRHQLSTARKDGNLNTTELSLVKNLDSISYYFADNFRNMVGVTNVTPEILDIIRLMIRDGIAFLSTRTAVTDSNVGGFSIGPQIIAEGSQLNSLEIDPVFKDTVNADIDLNLPKPFNLFNLVIRSI